MSGNLNEFGITHLRHVDLAVPDFETQRTFYKDTWGLTEQGKDGNLSYFAAEGSPEQFIYRIRGADEKRLDLLSFGAEDAATSTPSPTSCRPEGVQFASEPGALQTPGGGYGFRFFDPTAVQSRSRATSPSGSTVSSTRARRSRASQPRRRAPIAQQGARWTSTAASLSAPQSSATGRRS